MHRIVCVALGSLFVLATTSGAQPPRIEPSPALEKLHFQIGTWEVKTDTLDPNGKVVNTFRNRAVVTLAHNGLMLLHLHFGDGQEESSYRIWQYWDRYDQQLYDVSFDQVGHFEHRIETTNDGKLAFHFAEPQAFQDGVPRDWRKTYSEITPESYRLVWDYSEDGEHWTVMFDILYQRVSDPAAAVEPARPSGELDRLHPAR